MKLILTALLLVGTLLANDFKTRYDVKVGMFGKVGYADITLNEDKESYEIKLIAKMTGTAASLTGNRVETYISKGKIVEGEYIPDIFYKIRTSNDESLKQIYTFDHINKKVSLQEKKVKIIHGTTFDTSQFKIIKTQERKVSSNEEVLEKYIPSDILSTYLNTRRTCNEETRYYDLVAVGARNDRNSITVSYLDSEQKEHVKTSFSDDVGNIYNLKVEPLDKDKTTVEILMAFDNDGLMKEAVLGKAFWIGEIKAERVYHDVASK